GALALDGLGPRFALGLRSGGGIQRRIPAQARDHGHLTFATGQRQRYGRAAAIDDQDPPSPWQPATPWLHHLPPPIHAGFRPPWAALGLGPAAGGQAGPRPHSSAPGPRHTEHHGHPWQAKAAEDVLCGGAPRIPVAAFRFDLPPGPAFHRVVGTKDDRGPWGHHDREEQPEQNPTALAC